MPATLKINTKIKKAELITKKIDTNSSILIKNSSQTNLNTKLDTQTPLIKIKNGDSPTYLNPMWVTGFTDAEGSFMLSITTRANSKNLSIRPSFEIGLHSKDTAILHKIKNFFGVGLVTIRKFKDTGSFSVTKINDLSNIIVPHFREFPLQSQKREDFETWAKIVKLMVNKEHLTESGLVKIMELKSILNKGLTKGTNDILFVKPLIRAIHLVNSSEFKTIDPYWISGFVDGDGSFSVKIYQRKTSYQVELRFRITQHIRDAHLLGVIAEYLECGKVYTRANKLACDLEVFNFQDVLKKIIPFFQKYPLQTVKEKDFKDFSIVAGYMKNKDHLTPEGLELIRVLKFQMNNFRILPDITPLDSEKPSKD
uniref:LAGLIDADG homing endonuclease n=1 Tax=Cyathus striatus TaxID=68777 RepID=UPI0023F5219A|nr:LAGLIDADG homing endonuclease [Cyathus striatus]WDS46411.1 LAGLIDADG homing endonuclease [Cyathus striatus]